MDRTDQAQNPHWISPRVSRFFAVMDQMRKSWKAFTPGGPLNKSSLGLLAALDQREREGLSQTTVGELAEFVHHSPPAVSQKATLLVDQGYLERISDPRDRRVCYVRLTAQGRAAAEEHYRNFMNQLERALDELGEERAVLLVDLLGELTAALNRQSGSTEIKAKGENEPC